MKNNPVFSKGNKHYFGVEDLEEVAKSNLGVINLVLKIQPDEKQENSYKVISTNGTIKLDKQAYPVTGTGSLEKYVADTGEVLYSGRIRATYKIKSEEIDGSMFVVFSDDQSNTYISATIGTIGSEQSALVFGTHFEGYQKLVNSKLADDTVKEESKVTIASTSDWELAGYGSDNTTHRLDYPYGTKENAYPVIYVHAYKQDPRILGETNGKEKVRVIGQESYVKSLYQTDTSEFSYTYVEFWWDAQNVASIEQIYPQGSSSFTDYISIFTSLFPSPSGKIADLAIGIFSKATSYGTENTNGDDFPNYAYNDISVGTNTSGITVGTSAYNSVKNNGGINAWFGYTQWQPSSDSWSAFVRADADFYLTYENSSGYTESMLVRSDPVTLSHRIYKK